jgi:small subunit ribosomal protein S15
LDKERKTAIIKDFGMKEGDTGSAEVQVALLTEEINKMMGHLKVHSRDYGSQRGLLQMIGQRRRLLNYLNKTDTRRYSTVVSRLGLRK